MTSYLPLQASQPCTLSWRWGSVLATSHEAPMASKRRLPMTRAECEDGERPCPYVTCRHHLALDVVGQKARLVDMSLDPTVDPVLGCAPADVVDIRMRSPSCALDVAEDGEHTLDEIAEYLGLTRERVRQVEEKALQKMSKNRVLREAYE